MREPPIKVWFGASRFDDLSKWYKSDTFYTTKQGADVFFGFEILIKSEEPESVMLYYENIKEVSKGVLDVLFTRFNVEDYDDNGSVEGAILKYLEDLKSREFYISLEETCSRNHLREAIQDKLTRLRQEKIEFWTLLYEEYEDKKEEYDEQVREQLKNKKPIPNGARTETILDKEHANIKRQLQDFMLEPTHQVVISVSKLDDEKKNIKSDESLVAKAGADTILEIIALIREETPESVHLYQNYRDNVAGAVLETLAQAFSLAGLDDSGSIESAIVKRLNDLKNCEFHPSIEQLEHRLNFLRQEQVEFWTMLYEEYKTKKKDYDMGSLLLLKNKYGRGDGWRQDKIDSKLYSLHVREQKN